jgi:chorismate mutase
MAIRKVEDHHPREAMTFDAGIKRGKRKGETMKNPSGSQLKERLKEKRKKIDLVDRRLLGLLNRRLRLALDIGKTKRELGAKIYDPAREKELLKRLISENKGPLREGDLKRIFTMIVEICRKSEI